jgi:hypothetical protein
MVSQNKWGRRRANDPPRGIGTNRPYCNHVGRYGHLLPGAGDEAAELLDEYLDRWRAEKARNAALSEATAPMDVPAELAA